MRRIICNLAGFVLSVCLLSAQSVQTVSLQANPVSMKTFGKISGLSSKVYGLWHVTALNHSSATFTINFPVIQQCFPDVSFLTYDEAQLVLTRDQNASPWNVGLEIGQDAQLAAAAFLSPYALAAYPILKVVEKQIQTNAPNETKLLAVLAKASTINVSAGSDAIAVMLASVTHGAHTEKCTLDVSPIATPEQPPMRLTPRVSLSNTEAAWNWIQQAPDYRVAD